MRRKWFDFRYHSRWKNNLSQPLTYPMTVVKINRVIAIAYIYFSYASFDMSSLYASFVGCILNVQNAYDKRENVCAINLVPLKKLDFVLQLFSNYKECHYQLSLVTISFHKQKGLLENKKVATTSIKILRACSYLVNEFDGNLHWHPLWYINDYILSLIV